MDSNLLKGHLDLILLAALEHESKYGGQMISEVHERTQGAFQFKEGSLYPALHRMEKAGWIEGEFRQLPRGGSAVRFYTLTDSGQRTLREKREAYREFSGAVRTLLGV
ncbi:PadR family transcriptional regulator [Deinococcus ruber]|uniref:PadR family transcriptional regulator n=1 Tax=Deinococcus ruber TaxID=1848197 RepID=A0A918BW18_9DEIO|nr:helix-turn-helix transcriptional regulator [Deinococcus ruber]GGQ93540.1 PadR family transcriptional regulator [Deinococcus ruber]